MKIFCAFLLQFSLIVITVCHVGDIGTKGVFHKREERTKIEEKTIESNTVDYHCLAK